MVFPSLFHVMFGVGNPLARHFIISGSLSLTEMFFCWGVLILGGSNRKRKRKNHPEYKSLICVYLDQIHDYQINYAYNQWVSTHKRFHCCTLGYICISLRHIFLLRILSTSRLPSLVVQWWWQVQSQTFLRYWFSVLNNEIRYIQHEVLSFLRMVIY